MEDWYSPQDRGITRVAYGSTSGTTDRSDPYSYHQGDHSTQPNWDPFDFHQGTDRLAPKPPQPVPRPDVPLPKPDVPLPPMPDSHNPHEIRLPDGARNVTDDQGRVILTASADGSKTREVRYGDTSDPNKVSQVIIDHNRSYTRNPDGRSWTYSVDGQPGGTWYGDVHMSPKGEYSFEDDTSGAKRKFAANTSELTDPSQIQARPVPDGGGCNQYYPQPNQNPGFNHNRPIRGAYYNQGGYYNQGNYSDGGCSQGYRPSCGNPGAQFGAQVLAGMAGYGMPRYGGYPGFHPGYYGGGNLAGAIVGQVIGRAIFGHRRW